MQPTMQPSAQPSSEPSAQPSSEPSGQPTSRPTLIPQEEVCIFFSVDLRFIDEASKTDENTIAAFKVALAGLSGVESESVTLLNSGDSGTICGVNVSEGGLSRRRKTLGGLHSYNDLMLGGAQDDDSERNDRLNLQTKSGMASEAHLFTGVDDDTTDFRQAHEQAERRHAILVEQGRTMQNKLAQDRKLGRYDGWLNDPTPSPTLAPTHYPTFAPTTAPDPVTFTVIVYENAGAWDDEVTAEDEEERINAALIDSIDSGAFSQAMTEAAVSEGSTYLNDPSVFRSIDEVSTDDIEVTIGEDIIYNAPTSAPTTSNPTVSPTLSPATSRPTVPGETNPPTSIPTSSMPTTTPSSQPSRQPTMQPTGQPTSEPTNPTSIPTSMPSFYGVDHSDGLTDSYYLGVYLGCSAGGLLLMAALYIFWTWYKNKDNKKIKIRSRDKYDEESKDADPDDMVHVSELDLAAALKIVLKNKGYSTKNKYTVPVKAMKKVGVFRDGNSTKIFSASDAGLEKAEKGKYGGKSMFEIEYDSDEERKAAFKRSRRARQASGIVHDSDGDSSASDDEDTKLRRERDQDERELAAFHPKIKPLDFFGKDPRVNKSMSNRVSRRLLGDSRPQSMRDPVINLDDVAPATIRLSPLAKSARPLGTPGGSPSGKFGGTGGFSPSSSLKMSQAFGESVSPGGRTAGGFGASTKKVLPAITVPGIDVPYLGQTMDELAKTSKAQVNSRKSRTGTVDFQAPPSIQKVLEHALVFTKPLVQKDSLVAINYILTSLFDETKIRVLTRGFFHGDQIRTSGHFDEMYTDTMNYAMVSSPGEVAKELNVEEETRFEADMGMSFKMAEKQGRIFNEKDMCKLLQLNPEDFYQQHWRHSSKHHRIRKGIYVARFDTMANENKEIGEKVTKTFTQQKEMAQDDQGPVFCINGFFSSMRQTYNRSQTCLSYMVIEWDSSSISWPSFLEHIVGSVDPAQAVGHSIRGQMFKRWKSLGLLEQPSMRDNCVHASVSALEGLRERLIWIPKALLYTDHFGARLLADRFQTAILTNWMEKNPNVSPYDMNVLDVMRNKNSMQVIAVANELVTEERRLDTMKAERKVAIAEKDRPGSSKQLNLPLHIKMNLSRTNAGPPGLKMTDEIGSLAKNKSLSLKRAGTKESAFLATKPHANTPKVIALLKEVLEVFGIKILSQGKVTSSYIEAHDMFRKQYRELCDYSDPPYVRVEEGKEDEAEEDAPKRVFELEDIQLSEEEHASFCKAFEVKSWALLRAQKKLMTMAQALDVCPALDEESIADLHEKAEVVHKIRKGLYITRLDELPKRSRRKAPLYVINAFTGAMRNAYHAKNAVVNYMVVEWESSALSWADFQTEVIGSGNPPEALPGSIRRSISMEWEKLGLRRLPSPMNNCVTASTSAFEALRERLIWVKGALLFTDLFGSRILAARIPSGSVKKILEEKTRAEGQGKIRAKMRGKDSNECIEILQKR